MSYEPWAVVSKRIYWDRDVPLARWRERIAEGHRSYLPDAIATLSPVEFIRFFGRANFKRNWPALRASLPETHLRHAPVYDLAWSRALGGGFNLQPSEAFQNLPTKRKAFLIEAMRAPGQSIYEVARALGMQYRRAHEHATHLRQSGLVRSLDTLENGRRKVKLFPVYRQSATTHR